MKTLSLEAKQRRRKLYTVWLGMMRRCNNSNHKYYHRYGGRGIKVAKKWHIFESFLSDMENTFNYGLTLDRKDNNLGYSKANCRWTSMREQQNNRSDNTMLTFDGKTQTVAQWAREIGMNPTTLLSRVLKHGWSVKEALTISSKSRGPKIKGFGEYRKDSVLTNKQVLAIRKEYKRGKYGFGYTSLGNKYGVSFVTISKIVNRKKWKHI